MIKDNVSKLSDLKGKLDTLTNKLQKLSNKIITSDNSSNTYWNSMNIEVKKVYEEMRVVFRSMYPNMVESEYYAAVKNEIIKIKSLKFQKPKTINYKDVYNSNSHWQTVNSILQDGLSSYLIGLDSGQKTLNKFMRLSQQILVSEKKLNQDVEEGFLEKGSVWGAKKKIYETLKGKIEDGKTITVIDKNGKERHFDPMYYAEMVARTKIIEANNLAVVNTALDVGADLVQISSHNTTTPLCQEFEGKIYSISGKDPDFPALEEIPPFHQNCQHSMTVVFREVLEERGIEKYIDFSNGLTEEHPTRRNHIPVSQRNI